MEPNPRMKHTPDEVWGFLRSNGVTKVRQVGEEFRFLTVKWGEITPKQFVKSLGSTIDEERPQPVPLRRAKPRVVGRFGGLNSRI